MTHHSEKGQRSADEPPISPDIENADDNFRLASLAILRAELCVLRIIIATPQEVCNFL